MDLLFDLSPTRTKQNTVRLNNTTINCGNILLQLMTITCFWTQRPNPFIRHNDSLVQACTTHTLSNSLLYCDKTDKPVFSEHRTWVNVSKWANWIPRKNKIITPNHLQKLTGIETVCAHETTRMYRCRTKHDLLGLIKDINEWNPDVNKK